MLRRRLSRKRMEASAEPDVTTFMNLMVVLVPFLLINAVFSQVTILELSVPTAAGAGAVAKPNFAIEVIVRQGGLELANGSNVVAALPKKDGRYDLQTLSELLLRLKADYPEKTDATVLMEPEVAYDHLIQIMDTLRGAEVRAAAGGPAQKVALFPEISIGDAPL